MITVELIRHNTAYSLAVCGHARAAVKGKDIVCAGVSVLVHTAAQRLLDIQEELKHEPQIVLAPGQALLVAVDKEGCTKAKELFLTVMTGFSQIAQQYPQYVVIRQRQ